MQSERLGQNAGETVGVEGAASGPSALPGMPPWSLSLDLSRSGSDDTRLWRRFASPSSEAGSPQYPSHGPAHTVLQSWGPDGCTGGVAQYLPVRHQQGQYKYWPNESVKERRVCEKDREGAARRRARGGWFCGHSKRREFQGRAINQTERYNEVKPIEKALEWELGVYGLISTGSWRGRSEWAKEGPWGWRAAVAEDKWREMQGRNAASKSGREARTKTKECSLLEVKGRLFHLFVGCESQ